VAEIEKMLSFLLEAAQAAHAFGECLLAARKTQTMTISSNDFR
jgi:hypothetical protein